MFFWHIYCQFIYLLSSLFSYLPLAKELPFLHFLYQIICILLFLFASFYLLYLPPSLSIKNAPFPIFPTKLLVISTFFFTHSLIILHFSLFLSLKGIQVFYFPDQVTCTLMFLLLFFPVLRVLCQLGIS